jgi:hypothetical protein
MSLKEKSFKDCKIQSNSVITNTTGPPVFVRYNREALCTKRIIWDTKKLQI